MKSFISEKVTGKKITDVVFQASQSALRAMEGKNGESVVNGAFGTYFNEKGKIHTFDTVYELFDKVDRVEKAKYAAGIPGPKTFRDGVKYWLFERYGVDLESDVIATPGGTGALSSTLKNTLAPGETVIQPDIGWGPYKTIAAQHNVNIETYTLFNEEDQFNFQSFKRVTSRIMDQEGKVLVIINDPCQNPTGYTMTEEEWESILSYLDRLSDEGPVVLLHDVAYIDFHKGEHYGRIFEKYKHLNDNILVVLAFSASKTMTAYGMRVGAQVLISNDKDGREAFKNACENTARGIWSTVNNGGMMTFASLAHDKDAQARYQKEKAAVMDVIDERASILTKDAEAIGLDFYPYKEGFFITMRIHDEDKKDRIHKALNDAGIFFVNIKGGLRIALCSIQKDKLKGLAERIKTIYNDTA
ncbi:MAG: pyridoxal phosphate-dependent aminotransferase [Bacillota bacterium]